ncbi:MAG: radical SAM protein [Isosphaeraceae bacterium]|jgi:hypothetical protein|nr:MAG: radical SAM protein [Isosphaeraceae bacterium]
MAHVSEAACLLKNGAAFARRAGLAAPDGSLVLVGTKPGAFSLYFDDEPIYHLDLDGRWQRAYIAGTHYLKALDGTVDAIERVRQDAQMVLHRRRLSFAEAADLDTAVRTAALDLIERLDAAQLIWHAPPEGVALDEATIHDLLERVASRDAAAWFRDREAYTAAYGTNPLPFVPPSCSQPVILCATWSEQHPTPWVFSPSQAPPRDPDQFADHARTVAAFLGRRIAQARGIVLADGNALRQPLERILTWLEIASSIFPIHHALRRPALAARSETDPLLDGVYAFLDSPGQPLPEADYLRLAQAGLRHLDLGVISGSAAVRARHGAHWSDDDLAEQLRRLHAAGLTVGLIAVAGAGGAELAETHLAETTALLERLPLVAGDIVYLIDLAELASPETIQDRFEAAGITPLPDPPRSAQLTALREALQPLRGDRKIKVIPYTLDKQ